MVKASVLSVCAFVALAVSASAAPPEIRVLCSDPIPDEYIVVFKPGSFRTPQHPVPAPAVRDLATELALIHGGRVVHVYENAAQGYSTRIDQVSARRIAQDPRVDFVEQSCPVSPSGSVQTNPPWGLDRVDETDTPLDARYEYNETGAGVNIYIIDTGISPNSGEFGTRLKAGVNFYPDGTTTTHDEFGTKGHGTGVASVAAGNNYGVAKGAKLYPLRIFPHCPTAPVCPVSGTAQVKAAVDWLIANHQKPAVANMSFYVDTVTGGVSISSMETTIKNAVASGIVMVTSANNFNTTACNYTPSKIPEVVTVGATNSSDARWASSNFGSCVDLWAPGVNIPLLHKNGSATTNTGTSFSAPHVTGAVALYLQTNTSASPSTVASYLLSHATANTLTSLGAGSPNLLLFAKPGHACFSWSCSQATRTCTFDASCSRMPSGLGSFSWDFGDGTFGSSGSTVISHTYSSSSAFGVTLTILPWQAQSESEAGCVNVSQIGVNGCYVSGSTEQ